MADTKFCQNLPVATVYVSSDYNNESLKFSPKDYDLQDCKDEFKEDKLIVMFAVIIDDASFGPYPSTNSSDLEELIHCYPKHWMKFWWLKNPKILMMIVLIQFLYKF